MLLGLNGWSRAGKDTVANYLVERHGFTRFAFADPLRLVLLEVMDVIAPLSSDFIRTNGWDVAKVEMSWCVDAMIALGQGMRDHVDSDTWVRALNYTGGDIVVSDMRHLNELDRINNMGGKLWQITREGTIARAMDMILDKHEGWDLTLNNNGTLEELYVQVDRAVKAEQESIW